MKLNQAQQLLPPLKKEPRPLVWIAGDEPLLLQESADSVRQFCRQTGFEEREVLTVDRSFDWSLFSETVGNLSLFAERKLIELRLASTKLDTEGKQALLDYAASPNPDYLLLITSPRVEPAIARTKWFKQLEEVAWYLTVWPLSVDELPDWLGQRLMKAGLQPKADALQVLVNRIEGNLLAAVQEIEKLKLLANPNGKKAVELTADMIIQSVADSSRYNAYTLIDTALLGDARRSLKILHGLRSEGTDHLAVLGATCHELRRLLPALQQKEAGQPVARLADQLVGRNFKRKAAVNRALQRLRSRQIYALLDQARVVDYSVKGLNDSDPWLELENLFLRFCDTPIKALQRAS